MRILDKIYSNILGAPKSRTLSESEVLELRKRSLDEDGQTVSIRDIICSGDIIYSNHHYSVFDVIGFVDDKIITNECGRPENNVEFEMDDVDLLVLKCQASKSENYED